MGQLISVTNAFGTPDQTITQYIYELKSGWLSLVPALENALSQLDDYLDILNAPGALPAVGFSPGDSYEPFENYVPFNPYTVGFAYVFLEPPGALVWYPDTLNTLIMGALAVVDTRSGIMGMNTIPSKNILPGPSSGPGPISLSAFPY